MTSPGSIIVAHTRKSIHSLARVGNTQIFEPPKKIGEIDIEQQRKRERERESFVFTQNAQVLTGKKDERGEEKREATAATVLL